jgi:hypothetical protein
LNKKRRRSDEIIALTFNLPARLQSRFRQACIDMQITQAEFIRMSILTYTERCEAEIVRRKTKVYAKDEQNAYL